MTGLPATTLFLPWLRRGLATQIARVDRAAGGGARVPVAVAVSVNQGQLSAQVGAALLDPGDISAVDPRVFIRTWPAPGVVNAEPNYFPLVELEQADLPWRYTPARADAKDRLRPWLCLIVVREDEVESVEEPDATRKLAAVTVISAAALPDPDASWAWAHAQVSGVDHLDPAQTAALLATEPHRLVARLLCPRRLDEKTVYLAYVVPTFEAGRLAGLGQPVDPSLDPLTPAWSRGQTRVRLPLYYRWRFLTGAGGDFESLARHLSGRSAPPTVGLRSLDVSDPGAGLPAAASVPLALDGPLLAPSAARTPWSPADQGRWTAPLEQLLNAPADLQSRTGERTVAPPIYGSLATGAARLPQGTLPWLRELNIDPRLRVAAGLGALVVHAQRHELVAGAWSQVEGIREINEQLRFTHVSREAAARLHVRHLAGAPPDTLLAVTAPLHPRVATATRTVRTQLDASPVVAGVLAAPWRRLTRPLGPTGRRQARIEHPPPSGVFDRMNQGALFAAAMRPPVPLQMATPSRVGSAPFVRTALTAGRFIPIEAPAGRHVPPLPSTPPAGDDPSAKVFAGAAAALHAMLQTPPAPATPLERLDLAKLQSMVRTSIDPKTTITAGLLRRVKLAPTVKRVDGADLDPLVVAPDFPQPMGEALAALSPRWLLPGVDAVPTDTVSLLAGNQRFVEAFLVGLNHAMAQELLWSEYPVDLHGTFFRQFWDTPRSASDAVGPEAMRDILPIAAWKATAALGENSPLGAHPPDRLVLLVRGELLRRYPTTLVSAARVRIGADHVREVGDEERQPLFSGRVDPDIAFFGFDLTVSQARGTPGSDADPGWFFVLQEPPSEPRFGLEPGAPGLRPPSAWKDLSWGHLAQDAAGLAGMRYIDLDASLPDTRQIVDPLSTVWHADAGLGATGATAGTVAYATMRHRVRIAIHAAQMLPSS